MRRRSRSRAPPGRATTGRVLQAPRTTRPTPSPDGGTSAVLIGRSRPDVEGSEASEIVAGVDVDGLAGEGFGQVRGQEHHRSGDFRRIRQVTEGGGSGDALELLLVGDAAPLRQVLEVHLLLVAPDVAGVHGIDSD